jgi:hypothetical protein
MAFVGVLSTQLLEATLIRESPRTEAVELDFTTVVDRIDYSR